MEVKRIKRVCHTSPQAACMSFAYRNGFELSREPFGRRGSLIEVKRGGVDVGYRKSYGGALNLMKKVVLEGRENV